MLRIVGGLLQLGLLLRHLLRLNCESVHCIEVQSLPWCHLTVVLKESGLSIDLVPSVVELSNSCFVEIVEVVSLHDLSSPFLLDNFASLVI